MPSDSSSRPSAFRSLVRLVGAAILAGVVAAALALPSVGGAGIAARNAADGFNNLPGDLKTPPLPQQSRILATDGSTIATFYYENRVSVPLKRVAPIMRKAIVAIEDSRFYHHGGLDPKGTIRALVNDTDGENDGRQGGSTLTQQYVKNVMVENATTKKEKAEARAPTVGRKLRELRYALTVEKHYSKDQILQRYLNIAYFGDGAYGIQAAAKHYFDTDASKLTLKQAATLAGIVRNPYGFAPTLHEKAGTQRRNTVLARMTQLHEISHATAKRLSRQGLALHPTSASNGCSVSSAPFFCDYVIKEIQSNPVFGKTRKQRNRLLYRGGLNIHSSLSSKTQQAAQHAVDGHVPRDNDSGKAAAEALVEPGTGKIKGLAVDRKFGPDRKGSTSVDFAADADHGGSHGFQAGSTFKMFTLVAALRKGMGFGTGFHAPQSTTVSGFKNCKGQSLGSWNVHNAGDSESGNFDMRSGTAQSVNTYFAQLERKAGLCSVVKAAKDLGIHRADRKPLGEYAPFTLGINEVSPLDVAAAYAAIADHGTYCEPIAISSVTDSTGNKLKTPSAGCKRAVSKHVADGVTYLLEGTLKGKGTAHGLSIGRPAAAKTGTADNEVSSFFAGYTPQLASAVWMGDPRGGQQHPMNDLVMDGRNYGPVYGATIAGPIWQQTMIHALAGEPAEGFSGAPGQFDTRSPFTHTKRHHKSHKGGHLPGGGGHGPGRFHPGRHHGHFPF